MKIKISKIELYIFIGFGILLFIIPYLFTRSWGILPIEDIGGTIGGVTAPFLGFFGSILVYLALKAQVKANELINEQFLLQQSKENIQNFENSFYNLINFHINIVNNIEKLYDRSRIRRTRKLYLGADELEFTGKGKIVFIIEYDNISKFLTNEYYRSKQYENDYSDVIYFKDNESRLSVFKKIYSVYYSEDIDSQFGSYFRNLYRLIKIIDNYKFSDDLNIDFEKKYFYTSIVRAQFSDYEVKWIFINGLSNYGEKFKPLIEKYSLLKNISKGDEAIIDFIKFYDKSAFEKF